MPAEWQPHERTWMAWPPAGYSLGDTDAEAASAHACWAAVANAIGRFEPVTMLASAADLDGARALLDPGVTVLEAPLDDAWMRDIGPTFVIGPDGRLAGVDWVFNGWGAQSWATWEKDALISARVCEAAGVPTVASPMINEGGGIHVNGEGTVLVTRTVQLGQGRNENWTAADVEAELRRTLGVDRVIWVERGLTRDYDRFGTRGHIDIVACFVNADTVLFHDQRNPEHPDFAVSAEVHRTLAAEGDLRLVPLPAPEVLRDDEGWVDYSYVNHLVVNGGVILCAFDDPGDERAAQILRDAYPGREVVLVDARPLFARGGGIHCITQQQPATTPESR
ncbi:MAG: agmatine deiminase family protein [Actinobacteria bacterium]|nr:agmatine deiminase family protein [Actinomycetota bacterium]